MPRKSTKSPVRKSAADLAAAKGGQVKSITPAQLRQTIRTTVSREVQRATRDFISTVRNGDWLGPQQPVTPQRPDDQPIIRDWQYLPGYNVNFQPRKYLPTTFAQLRWCAREFDLLRAVIERRKAEIESLDWEIVARDGTSLANDRQAKQIVDFYAKPDGVHNFPTWQRMILEEMFVTDAATIYPVMANNGTPLAFHVIDGACYSDDTEVLTRRGWLKFQDTNESDEFATRKINSAEFEWQKATYRHEKDWDSARHGNLFRFASTNLDILVSPNHRMLVTQRGRAKDKLAEHERIMSAKELAERGSANWTIPVTSWWKGEQLKEFKLSSPRSDSPNLNWSGDDYCAFMGMYLSEGSSAGKNMVAIWQDEKSKGFKPYKEVIERLFGSRAYYGQGRWVLCSSELNKHLVQFGHAANKFIPDQIKNATPEQLEIFWRFYLAGDGYINQGQEAISTTSRRMADDLQEIAQKMGFCAMVSQRTDNRGIRTQPIFDVYRCRQQYHRPVVTESVPYQGRIFCVSVPNEILFVRRNGKAAWCGNTILPLIDSYGRLPAPPDPSYQQVWEGLPYEDYSQDELMYCPRNPSPWMPVYGYPQVEQCLLSIAVGLKMELRQYFYFTEGTMPDSMIGVPENWTGRQIAETQGWFDALMKGNLQKRSGGIVFVPGGMKGVTLKDYKFDKDQWEAMARLICSIFQVSPQPFVAMMNRDTGATAQVMAIQEALEPDKMWFASTVMDHQLHHYWKRPDLQFKYKSEDNTDIQEKANAEKIQVTTGQRSINELRLDDGLEPVEGGDDPFVVVGNQVVLVKDLGSMSDIATTPPPAPMMANGNGNGGDANGKPPPANGADGNNKGKVKKAAETDGYYLVPKDRL